MVPLHLRMHQKRYCLNVNHSCEKLFIVYACGWQSVKEMHDECTRHLSLHSNMVFGVVVATEKEKEAPEVHTRWKLSVVHRCGNIQE